MLGGRRRRREEGLAEKDRWRVARKLMDEDVTVLGEQLAELHVDTIADELDPVARDHYRRALEHYDQAKHLLSASSTAGSGSCHSCLRRSLCIRVAASAHEAASKTC